MKCLPSVTAFVVVAVLMHADVRGQGSNTPPPEMKVLEKLLGTWKVENIGKVPEATRSTSTHKRELILGGRFVEDKGFDDQGKPISSGMYTYDAGKRAYRWWFFDQSGFYVEATGSWDESRRTFTFTNKQGWGDTGVTTIRFRDETAFDWTITGKDTGGKVVFQAEGEAVRQK